MRGDSTTRRGSIKVSDSPVKINVAGSTFSGLSQRCNPVGQGRQAGATRKTKVARHGEVLGQGRQAGAARKIKVAPHGEVLGQGRQAGAIPKD